MTDRSPHMDAAAPPWWLDGQELCAFCGHLYVLQMEFRCVVCDDPVCPLCVVEVLETMDVVCPPCHAGAGED